VQCERGCCCAAAGGLIKPYTDKSLSNHTQQKRISEKEKEEGKLNINLMMSVL